MSVGKTNYVYSISGLFLKRGHLGATIEEDINEFINAAPMLAENIKTSVYFTKDAQSFQQNMSRALALLQSVSAKWLQAEAEAIMRFTDTHSLDECRKNIEPFIADFLSLSIEMQMAQKHAAEERPEDKKYAIEAYRDIANIVTAVSRLIGLGEYGKARELVTDIEDPDDSGAADVLLQSLYPDSAEAAENLVKHYSDKYKAKIAEIESRWEDSKKEILAVDDRPDVLRMVAGVLRERYKVLTATDGAGALKILEKKTPDLFILDIDMPNMDGFELARQIRLMDDFAQTPILFLTSNSSRDYVLNAFEAGGSDFIVKPAKHDALLAKVGKYLARETLINFRP